MTEKPEENSKNNIESSPSKSVPVTTTKKEDKKNVRKVEVKQEAPKSPVISNEVGKNNKDYDPEYSEFIKASVKDKSYFKDALTWYFFHYVNPFCERTVLVFAGILALFVLFCLSKMIDSAFPLVEEVPVIIRSQDQSLYFPNLVPLKPNKDIEVETVDESVVKYLLSVYITDREGYDYSKAKISDINKKFNRLKNNSSDKEYRNFQLFMSKDNPNSPIHHFGKNVVKNIKIESVKFLREEAETFAEKAKNYLNYKVPTDAEIRFTSHIKGHDGSGLKTSDEKHRFLVKINFKFSGIDKEATKSPISFVVNEYKLYKVN